MQVNKPKTANATEKLPAERLKALLFALPRNRLHAQHVASVHACYLTTVESLVEWEPSDAKRHKGNGAMSAQKTSTPPVDLQRFSVFEQVCFLTACGPLGPLPLHH